MGNTIKTWLLLLLVFQLSFSIVYTGGIVNCEWGCVVGHTLHCMDDIFNDGGDWAYIHRIEIFDEGDAKILEEPCSLNLSSGEDSELEYSIVLPNEEVDWFRFQACITYETLASAGETLEYCYWNGGFEVTEPECTKDSQCEEDEECKNDICYPLHCGWNDYIEDHKCVEYECIHHSDCDSGEQCYFNKCVYVECHGDDDCSNLQECENYTCVDIECRQDSDCADNQICMSGHYCRDLDCPGFEIPENHTCVNPECIMDEGCVGTKVCINQTCVPLECEGGYAANHACIPYECNESPDCARNEFCIGFFCEPLECQEGYLPHEHRCVQCLEDSDCTEKERCSENSCIPVSCMAGEVVLHECVMPKCSLEEGVWEESLLEEQVSQEPANSPEPAREARKGCLPAFALLFTFILFLKNKVVS